MSHADTGERTQTCLAVDLFEVIAELAALDLEQDAEAAEAIALAERAERALGLVVRPRSHESDPHGLKPADGAS